jgi:3-mercaptopyruvate sulfurtransferase SseA
MAQQFIAKGFEKVYVLKGGWKEWHQANFPVESKAR